MTEGSLGMRLHNRRRSLVRGACLGLGLLLGAAGLARAGVLYDGTLGTVMTQQNWLLVTDPLSGSLATQSFSSSVTTLDTTARRSDSAGYPSFITPGIGTLDRSIGFTLSWEIQLLVEQHASTNRAGFSAIVVSDDLVGLEIGFWANSIWAQNDAPLFTHGESASFDTTLAIVRYDLEVLGNSYQLEADGVPILSGALRDYSSFGFPYMVPNFIFFGDNTSSASAKVRIARVELTPVPEASTGIWLAALAATLAVAGRCRQ